MDGTLILVGLVAALAVVLILRMAHPGDGPPTPRRWRRGAERRLRDRIIARRRAEIQRKTPEKG